MEANQTINPRELFFSYTFHYTPLVELATAAAAAYAFAALLLLVATLKNRRRPAYLWIPCFGAAVEAVGYGARIGAAQNADLNPFIIQAVVILVVPIALAVVNYVVVGDLLVASGKQVWCLTPQRIARTFLISDVVCFFLQSGGASMMINESLTTLGQTIAVTGIIFQLCFFTAFVALMCQTSHGKDFRLYDIPQLKQVFHALYASSFFMYIRNLYRAIEFLDPHGYVATHEWVFAVFECLAIFVCLLVYCFWHFGRLLPLTETELVELVNPGIKAVEQSSFDQDRLTVVTVDNMCISTSNGSLKDVQCA